MVGSFCTSILFVLTLASDKATFYRNILFSISVTSNKRQYSSFWKKAFIFQKIYFKVKVMKTFKISFDFHVKTYRSLNGGLSWKSRVLFLRRAYALSVYFKFWKLKICRKTCWKEQPFVFCFLEESPHTSICTLEYVIMECIELNWLFKHMKKVRSSQASISINSCSKT